MKLIGIVGKSGAGKTTLSKMLQKNDSIGVIHLDEVISMREIKEKMPKSIVDKDLYANADGEKFMVLDKRVRKIKDRMLKNKLFNKLYFGILHLPKEILIKKAVNQKMQEGKETIIVEGSILGDFKIYDKFDYLIQIDSPLEEREKRVMQRKDLEFDEQTILQRDLDFKNAEKKGRKKGKIIDEVIQNTGTKEDLQRVADRIYDEQIKSKNENNKELMREKYGGYKTKPIIRKQQVEKNNLEKDDLSK